MHSFNNRQINLIIYLLNQEHYISAKELAARFQVSVRTIRYDLDLVENWLNENDSIMVRIPNKGIQIKSKLGKEVLLEKLKFISVENRILSENERIQYVVLELLTVDDELTLAEVGERLFLSRNTIIKVLKRVKKYLKENGLELVKVYAKGFKVIGNEILKRRLLTSIFLDIFNISNIVNAMNDDDIYEDLMSYTDNKFINFGFQHMRTIFIQLLKIEERFNYYLTDFAVAKLILYLNISVYRIKKGNIITKNININFDRIEADIAVLVSKNLENIFDISLEDSEVQEITNHLVESKSFVNYENNCGQQQYTSEVEHLTRHIIEYCEKELNVQLINDSQLINDLSVHLKSLLTRMKNGKQLDNDLTDEITKRFPIVYQIIEQSLDGYGDYKFSIPEMAYIALHIRAAYERNYQENYMSTALVICQEGVSILNILVTTLQRNIPELRIIKSCSIYDYEKHEKEIDLVITTSNFKSKSLEVVKVSPFLENEDIYKIRKTLVKLNKVKQIYKYNQREKVEGGREILLEDLLSIDMINLNVEAKDWEDAIRKASKPLVDHKKINTKYVENMIKAVRELGPYIVIMPEIAFAHARPDETVNETCMSMITLKKPIEFGSESNDPVSIVFAFGAENGNDHLKALQDLAKFLALDENVNFLKNSTERNIVLNKLINI